MKWILFVPSLLTATHPHAFEDQLHTKWQHGERDGRGQHIPFRTLAIAPGCDHLMYV